MGLKAQPTFEGRKEETTTPLAKPADAPTAVLVTQADLDADPNLVAAGVKVGDVMQLPKEETNTAEEEPA